MAEAFARAYGSDAVIAASAGISPASIVQPMTQQVVGERGVKMVGHFPKGLEITARESFDVVVNMSGTPVRVPGARIVEWTVQDPIGLSETVYRNVAAQIEDLVMRLVLDIRTAR
jgi:protein-tyrosine-phosphatase